MHKEGWIHHLKWNNPYHEPPDNLPLILATWTDKEPTTEDFLSVYPDYKLGCGFGSWIEIPRVKRGKLPTHIRKRANDRRKKTIKMKWIKKNLPLLADDIIKKEGLDWRALANTSKE